VPRTVLVTGANSGIGLSTCLELARAGYDVVGTVRTDDKAETVEAAARAKGLTVTATVLDVSDSAATEQGLAEVQADREVWGVVNNAGYAQPGAVEDVDDEAARRQLEVNVVAPARVARLLLPGMRARGGGRIVNVSSVAGRLSLPLMGWYCASKHALEALTDALRVEVEPYGVRVTLIEPGTFGTGIWPQQGSDYPTPATPEYAAAYDRARSAMSRTDLMPDPVWVARTVRVALGNPVPLARYLVGADAVGGVLSQALVPTAVADYVKGVTSGVRKPGLPLPFLNRG
jgi:NAD(P)-dependent dehydrogenase (short-subunit alcohol dehydrogenase family)